MASIYPHPIGYHASQDGFCTAIEEAEIKCLSFDEWEGFEPTWYYERDDLQEQITIRRKDVGTFRHERQTKAEAEALMIIQDFRSGTASIDDERISDAYFVSYTRVIDRLAGSGLPITMRPEAVLQWLTTVSPYAPEELGLLMELLLWELSELGLDIVDTGRLQSAFSPFIVASKQRLRDATHKHRALIARRYGEGAAQAFAEVGDIESPIVAHGFFVQQAEELERERRRLQIIRAKSELTAKERGELERYRARRKEKQERTRRKQRARASSPKKKRKKRK